MAKVSLARKKELNQPDEFITFSNKALDFARQNQSMITAVVSIIVLILVAIAGYQYHSSSQIKKASIQLSKDLAWYDEMSKNNNDVPLKEVKEKQGGFFKKYSGTPSAILAMAKYAGIFFSQGDYSSAAALYKDALPKVDDDSLKNVFLMNLGQCYEAMDKKDQAIDQYKKIISGKGAIKKDEALFHLGLIYAHMDKPEESLNAFTQIKEQYENSMFYQLAKDKING